MATFEFTAPDGKTYEVAGPEGATQAQAFEMLQGQLASDTPPAAAPASATFSAGRALNDIPRQIGLTARYGLEGLANTAQIATEPLRYVTDRLTGQTGKTVPLGVATTRALDALGLPKPETPLERTVGEGARLMAGGGGAAGLAGRGFQAISRPVAGFLAQEAPALLSGGQNLLRGLAARPGAQVGAAAGAGLAGGASREAGGDALQQFAATLLGGIGGGMGAGRAENLVASARNLLRPAMTPQQLDVQLSTVLQRAGTDYSALPEAVRRSLRAELASSLQAGKELDPAAVSRLADFRAVGATPTRGMLSQNPVDITREQNLAKMAANSADTELHGLPLMQNRNNATLIGRLNDLGGRTETDPLVAGRMLTGRIQGTRAGLRGAEGAAWDAARAAPGYRQPIYPDGLNAMNRALGEEGMMGFMNPTISRYMEAFQTGAQPFTPQAYRNLQSMLAGELAKGGNEAAAARIARQALESTPMRPITNPRGLDLGTAPVTSQMAGAMRAADAAPGNAIDLVDQARRATRAAYQYEDSSPLVRSALSDTADPTRIAQRFVIGGTPDEAAMVAREAGPAGRATIRDALATHIKRQALSGAADEVGKVSQARLNAAIRSVGEEKLRLFFSPEEIGQLRSTARVASLMQVQPIGSAVNNSNSGALLLGRGLDALDSKLDLLPFGSFAKMGLTEPVRNINMSIQQRAAQNMLPGLLRAPPVPPGSPLLLPAAAVAGGLLSP